MAYLQLATYVAAASAADVPDMPSIILSILPVAICKANKQMEKQTFIAGRAQLSLINPFIVKRSLSSEPMNQCCTTYRSHMPLLTSSWFEANGFL